MRIAEYTLHSDHLSGQPPIDKVPAKWAGCKYKTLNSLPTQGFLIHSLLLTQVHLPEITFTKYVQFESVETVTEGARLFGVFPSVDSSPSG